jgi:hypothetical protein
LAVYGHVILSRDIHLSPHENILTIGIALINIHYLYIVQNDWFVQNKTEYPEARIHDVKYSSLKLYRRSLKCGQPRTQDFFSCGEKTLVDAGHVIC